MKFSDETLMAYADGELDAATRAAIEQEIAADPDIARRVAQHQLLAKKIGAAFEPVLREAVPDRLNEAVAACTGSVIDLAQRRAAKPARTWSWPQWSAIAASVAVGILAGR